MQISLTAELDKVVERHIADGRFHSAEEVVREALRLLDDRDREHAQELTTFRASLATRLDSLKRGECIEPDELWSELGEMSAERRRTVA